MDWSALKGTGRHFYCGLAILVGESGAGLRPINEAVLLIAPPKAACCGRRAGRRAGAGVVQRPMSACMAIFYVSRIHAPAKGIRYSSNE
ncbi:hypothetical protein LY78DRAFT_481319 [Colletotrichum sublineola]|nr:hypothetical protein LY78DRAFT_481319 [Colletotrichum sublineola]